MATGTGTGLLMRRAVLVLFMLPAIMEQCRRIDPLPVQFQSFLQSYDRPDPGPIQNMYHTITTESPCCFSCLFLA